jgi:hypothetical protein
MKISELIKDLEAYKREHGDVSVTTKEEIHCDKVDIKEGYGSKDGEFIYLEGDYES